MEEKSVVGQIPEERKASEYLANERTFLAWVRTSIAVTSLGFVIAKFSIWVNQFEKSTGIKGEPVHTGISIPTGVIMMGFGGLLVLLAYARFHWVNRAIDRGFFEADRGMVLMVTMVVALLSLLVIGYVVISSGWV